MSSKSQNNRSQLTKWIINCVEQLAKELVDDQESLFFLEVFLTQYELVAQKIPFISSLSIIKLKLGYPLKFTRPVPNSVLEFQITNQNDPSRKKLDNLCWIWQANQLDMIKIIFPTLRDEGFKIGVFSNNKRINSSWEKSNMKDYQVEINRPQIAYLYKSYKPYKKIITLTNGLDDYNFSGKKLRFKDLVWLCFEFYSPIIFQTIKCFEHLVQTYDIRSIFIGYDLTMVGRTVALLSKKYKVYSFSIMHGALNENYKKFFIVDELFVYGKGIKASIDKVNREVKTIVVGSPKVEKALAVLGKPILIKGKESYNKKILVAFSGPGNKVTLSNHLKITQLLSQLVKEHPSYLFLIKLHQKDRLEYYKGFNTLPNIVFIRYKDENYQQISLYDWIRGSELLITAASMVALEAMILSKPVIALDVEEQLLEIPFIKEAAAWYCKDRNALKNAFNAFQDETEAFLVCQQKAKQYIENYFYFPEHGVKKELFQQVKSIILNN